MKQITSKQTGLGVLTPTQTIAVMLTVLGWAIFVAVLWAVRLPILVVIVAMALSGGVAGMGFFLFIYDTARFDRIVIWLKYYIRAMQGKTILHQLTVDMKTVRKFTPIEEVFDDGMIQYTKHRYGVVFRYDPAENRKESIDEMNTRIEKFVNTLTSDIWVSFHFSHSIETSTTVEDMFLESLNDESKSLAARQHLFGMYVHITKNQCKRTTTSFLMSVRLGEYKNEALARRAMQSNIPGMLTAMHEAGIYASQLIDEDVIVGEFKKFAILEEI